MRPLLAALLLVLATAGMARPEPSASDVIARMLARRTQGDDAVSVLDVVLIAPGGQRTTRTVATYRKRCGTQWRSLAVVRGPADVAGAGVLSWMDPDGGPPDMWLYLPELGRVRQLSAMAQSESFLGSDLTYEDMSGWVLHERTHALLSEEDVDAEPTYRIESRPRSDWDPYARIVTWVSRRTFLPARVEYYDRRGALLKVGRFGRVLEVKGIPTPAAIEMDNVQTGHRTEVALREVDFDRGLACDLFTRRQLARVP
jgi:hypothetical protein